MKLTAEQEASVRSWASEGASISDIQTRLTSEYDLHLSYLDVRFLLIDLNVSPAEKEQPKKAPEPPAEDPVAAPAEDPADGFADAPAADGADAPLGGGVSVEISKIQRPGFAITGSVTDSTGKTGEWGVTNDGRVAFDFGPENPKYRMSQEDLMSFQQKLREMLSTGY